MKYTGDRERARRRETGRGQRARDKENEKGAETEKKNQKGTKRNFKLSVAKVWRKPEYRVPNSRVNKKLLCSLLLPLCTAAGQRPFHAGRLGGYGPFENSWFQKQTCAIKRFPIWPAVV